MLKCGEALISLLRAYGVDTVFGIPGVHTLELYRNFKANGLRHVTPRHEQGAGLMAHGYALATGRPAACFLITGPGILNAATAIAGGYADSVPMLVFCSTNKTSELGMDGGRLHEVPSQLAMLSQITEFTHTLLDPGNLPELMARAFTLFETGRPRPVCIEIPTDILERPSDFACGAWPLPARPSPDAATVARVARQLESAEHPFFIFGGGCKDATAEATALAERVDALVLLTQAAKGVVREDHPLCLGFTLPLQPAHRLVETADVVLAVGTELSEVDRYMFGDYAFGGELIRIDIAQDQLSRNYRPNSVLLSDAGLALSALLGALGPRPAQSPGKAAIERARHVRAELDCHRLPRSEIHHKVMDVLQDCLPPDAIISADSSQLAYAGAMYYRCSRPRSWLFPCNFGGLGTGLPMAVGAKLGAPERPIVCIAGDGGFLYTIEELAVAVEEKLQITIILWNNDGYGEIRDAMEARQIPPVGVNFKTSNFVGIARGFGCAATRAESLSHLRSLVIESLGRDGPTLIEVHQEDAFLRAVPESS